MDALPSFSTNLNSSAPPFQSAADVAPHQLQPGAQTQTLPPLQPNSQDMQQHPPYASYSQHSRAPASSGSPVSSGVMATYPPPAQTPSAGRNSYSIMNTSPYQQQQYPATSAMPPQATTAASQLQAIAPAPTSALNRPPVLRPMPAPGVMAQQGTNSPYGQSPLMPTSSMMPDGDTPTHVVGSQGRRGILPSAPGRPAAPQPGSGAKTQIPQKDADGKFPCPHCTKTYLHAKHLKRHLLRHTGDRPYMCVLCRDTFSRSDILKRHFIKCSVRRGNPTGASHLSHPQAHVKKNVQAQQKTMGEGDVNHLNGMNNHTDGMVNFGLMPASDGMNNMSNDQSQLSRSNSMNRLEEANRDRRSMPGGNSFEANYNGGNMPANMNTQISGYSMPQGNSNGMPMGFQSNTMPNSTDWSQVFQAGAHHPHTQIVDPPNLGQNQIEVKQEPNLEPVRVAGIAGSPSEDIIPSWGVPTQNLPYQYLSNKIIGFLLPSGSPSSSLQNYFGPDNIRDFLGRYSLVHVHFPFIHIPTFCVLAHVHLAAAMCCVGACYSDRIPAAEVREVMNHLKSALERSSTMYASLTGMQTLQDYSSFGIETDLEELQAIILMLVTFCWHGTPSQQDEGRRIFPHLASMVRKAHLLELSKNSSLLSSTHQPEFMPSQLDFMSNRLEPSSFDWAHWVEQEKRVRTMYTVFLLDCSLGLFFNTAPNFDALEVCLPLPADEAAWDAADPEACAGALGLCGPEISRHHNPDGTQRPTQPQLPAVLEALLDKSLDVQPSVTNLTGKWIIVHGLFAMLRRFHLHQSATVAVSPGSLTKDMNVSKTEVSAESSYENAAPVEQSESLLDVATQDTFFIALDKFKANWDIDLQLQSPQSLLPHPRRYGFFRDAIHFYWLARYLLRHTARADLHSGPDQTFARSLHLLESVRHWILTDGAAGGEELGPAGDINTGHEVTAPYLDMTKMFSPLPSMLEALGEQLADLMGSGTH